MRHYVAINQINHSSIVKCYHTSNMYHTFLFYLNISVNLLILLAFYTESLIC